MQIYLAIHYVGIYVNKYISQNKICLELTASFYSIWSCKNNIGYFYIYYIKCCSNKLSIPRVLKQTQKGLTPSAEKLALFFDCLFLTYNIPKGHELFLGLKQTKILLDTIPHNIECLQNLNIALNIQEISCSSCNGPVRSICMV